MDLFHDPDIGLDRGGRAVRDHLAEIQHDHAVAAGHHKADLVLDRHDRPAGLAQAQDDVAQPVGLLSARAPAASSSSSSTSGAVISTGEGEIAQLAIGEVRRPRVAPRAMAIRTSTSSTA